MLSFKKGETYLKTVIIAVLSVILGVTSALAAENGIITGKAVDANTGEPMIGARVSVQEIGKGAITKVEGDYRIANIKPGIYTVRITYVGYAPIKIKNVVVKPGEVKKLNAVMQEKGVLKDEVVVTAQSIKTAEAALLRERQKSESVSDAIGAEMISQTGSGNAAEAIEKITGATTSGGKYVYIRGLGDRYCSAQLNGANLPTSDPDKKAVHFDLFPSGLIENITAVKTATPDKPGDFTGGAVNIKTKSFPEKFTSKLSFSSSINAQTTGENILSYGGGETDWMGMDDGSRSIPSVVKNNEIPTVSQSRSKRDEEATANAMLLDKQSRAFNDIYAPSTMTAPINSNLSLSVGDRVSVFGESFGYLASFSYSRKFSNFSGGKIGKYTRQGSSSEELMIDYYGTMQKSAMEASWSAMGNFAYDIDLNNQISLNLMYNQNGETSAAYQDGYKEYYQKDTERRVLDFVQRSISSVQMKGSHNFASLLGMKADWQISYNQTAQDQPDYRTFDNEYTVDTLGDGSLQRSYTLNKNDNNALPSRYFRDLNEDLNEAKLDLEVPLGEAFDSKFKFKTGLLYNEKNRDFAEQRYVFRQDGDDMEYTGNPNQFMEDSTGIREWKSQNFYYFGNYLEDRTQAAGSYTSWQKIFASYGMVDFYLFDKLRLVGGVRYETTDLLSESEDPNRPKGEISSQDWLPSVNLTYHILPNMNFRLAYGKTIARPTFREMAPYDSYMPIERRTFIGNDTLKRTVVNNYDARWEWFTNPGEIFSVGAFYKDFRNPIELAIINRNQNVQPINVKEATLYGAEFEFRKKLDFVSFLSNFQAGFNLTLVESEVTLPDFEYDLRKSYDSSASSTRDLQGQSPFVVNFDLAYSNQDLGTNASVHYYVFGKRLSEVGFGCPDYYEHPSPELNFVLNQRIFDGFKLKLGVDNVLDSRYYKAVEFNGKEYISKEYKIGRAYSLSVSYDID